MNQRAKLVQGEEGRNVLHDLQVPESGSYEHRCVSRNNLHFLILGQVDIFLLGLVVHVGQPACGPDRLVLVGAGVDQMPYNFQETPTARHVEHRLAACVEKVFIAPTIYHKDENVDVPSKTCSVKRRITAVVGLIFRAFGPRDECIRSVNVSFSRGARKCGLSREIGLVDVRPGSQKQSHYIGVAILCGSVQGGGAVHRCLGQICLTLEETPHNVDVATHSGDVEWGSAVLVLFVYIIRCRLQSKHGR
jgi:hypothetical protein